MKKFLIPLLLILPPLLMVGALAWGVFAMENRVESRIEVAVAGRDNTPVDLNAGGSNVDISGILEVFVSPGERSLVQLAHNWPFFRGIALDFVAPETQKAPFPTDLIAAPQEEPVQATIEPLWVAKTGEGYTGAAIAHGCAYILDYNEEKRADSLRCFDIETGKELWKRYYFVDLKRNHGFSRTVPAVYKDTVITIGPKAHVLAVDAHTGAVKWTLDMIDKYGSEIPDWNGGQCPLIYDDKLLLAPSGPDVLMLAVNPETGEVLWEAPNPDGYLMSHASITMMNLHGIEAAVFPGLGGMAAVSPDDGSLLFSNYEWTQSVIVPCAIELPNDQIYLTAGYGAGGVLYDTSLAADGKTIDISVAETWKPPRGVSSEQQTPIMHGEYMYAVLPKSAARFREQMACYHYTDLKKPVWSSGREYGYGLGPYVIADGKLIVVDDYANITVMEATPEGFQPYFTAQLIDGGYDAWGPLAIADQYLLVKDSYHLICLDMRDFKPTNQ